MPTIYISINADEVRDSFAKLAQRLRDTSPAMVRIAEIMARAVDKAFENEQDPITDKKWKPLSKVYRQRRQTEGSLGSILARSRELHNSMRVKSGASTATVSMGQGLAYAAIHQHGGTIDRKSGTVKLHFNRRGRFVSGKDKKAHYGMKATYEAYTITIPQRRYLGVNQGDLDEMKASLARYLLGTL